MTELIMVLEDGERYSSLEGCAVVEVPYGAGADEIEDLLAANLLAADDTPEERTVYTFTGEQSVPRGGFDGILVTFGEGCDDDTLNNSFTGLGHALVRITLADATTFDAWRGHFGYEDGQLLYQYRDYDHDAGNGVGPAKTVPANQIVGVHIY